ncbi:Glu/Leu/Phe/Val dehydrogenase family protein [Rhodococcus sp. T2V]|uniref:Glu/Leu/Phe/Val dehydrogenase family protein n=1 Tax=Rhodococcus sp. T2V TaxID=3034164 RepID=UPI0023E200D5|nr:Glu/Leu/Phe/Val dehydrogenase family protein [Rhodococcus sp. T2V]MDF3306611.1 Glu/Leu/Phe/Val dehydrogenase dimerization domain-containing protein [Rhodococcus sp. T2V]
MDQSIFAPLKAAGLTSLKLQYDWRTDRHRLYAAKEWDADLDFAQYNHSFHVESLLTSDAVYLGHEQVLALYAEHGLADYLDEVLELLRGGKHFGIEVYYHQGRDIRFMCHQHSRRQGLMNKRHATLAGGIRRHPLEERELDVIIDGLNLGRAMSFKNIAADLDFGGCKTTVQMDPLNLDDLEALGFLSFALDHCRTMTGPDMNFPTAMSDVINAHFSKSFTSGPASPLGETGKPTAYGTYLALKEAIRFEEGTDTLTGKTVAVMGLGAVGWSMAEYLLDGGARVVVSDIDEARAADFLAGHPGRAVESVPVGAIMDIEADVFCPCAIGGILDEDTIRRIQFRYVFGPANNQLKATTQDEEIRLADLLAERGILFQTEWWHNTAGVMCGAEEYLHGADANTADLMAKVERIVPAKTRANLTQAKELGITPTENAYRTCVDTIYQR